MLEQLWAWSFLAGSVLILVAEFRMRAPGAPPVGCGPRGWPHQRRELFTRAGFRVSMTGWSLWVFAGLVSAIRLLAG